MNTYDDVRIKSLTFHNDEYDLHLTGEEIAALVNEQKAKRIKTVRWVKAYRSAFVVFQQIFKSTLFNAFIYIIGLINWKTNTFTYSRSELMRNAGVSSATAYRIIDSLLVNDMIRLVRNHVYMMNPSVLSAGSEESDTGLIRVYYNLPPDERVRSRFRIENTSDSENNELNIKENDEDDIL